MIIILAGGPKEYIPDLKKFQLEHPNATWCGVDAGTKMLLEYDIIPKFAIGDFDSISNAEFEEINSKIEFIQKLPAEKNQTDLEAALAYVSKIAEENFIILGATGGRFDHAFANIMIIQKFLQNREVTISDRQNEIRIISPGTHSFERNEMKYISFLPISEKVEKVTLSGMKYPLNRATLKRNESLGVSNEITQHKGNISFEKGICLVVRSKD